MSELDYIQKMIKEQESLRKMFELPDYMQKMIEEQESLRKMLEPPGYMQKMIEEQESLRKMLEPPGHIQKMIEEQESLRKMLEPPGYMQKMIEEQESLRKMLEPPDYVQKMIEEQETFREMFVSRGAAASALQALINQGAVNPLDFTERIKSFADELSIPDFYINSDGSLFLEEQSINVSELNTAVRIFFEEISEDCSIESVLSRLVRLKKPAQRIAIWILNKIIIAFFVSVMAGLFTMNLQHYLDSSSLKSKREVTQTIKNLPPEIDIDEYKGYRVVTADILNLRQNPNMKSYIIAKLNRGKLVYVVQKKKNWTKVKVKSSDSCGALIGWVATRHTVSLNR